MNTTDLFHRISWMPALLQEKPLCFRKIVFLIGRNEYNETLSAYQRQLAVKGYVTTVISDAEDISSFSTSDTIIVHIPLVAMTKHDIYEAATKSCLNLITAAQVLYRQHQSDRNKSFKIFSIITKDFGIGDLGNAVLYGLARVMKMEMPEIFGGLFEDDQACFPLSAIQYAQGFDVVKVLKGVAQTASLHPFSNKFDKKQLQLKPDGTYLITGGTRGIRLETAAWMVERGACSILLVSHYGLPAVLDSKPKDADIDKLISHITKLEAMGATVHVLAIDLNRPGADSELRQAIDNLSIPPVKGVIHVADIASYPKIENCASSNIADILAPEVVGALNLDTLFPPGVLDFFFLASSVGQLASFPEQLSYAPKNVFLDCLAEHRIAQGDRIKSIQWNYRRGVGLPDQSKSTTHMITREMHAREIIRLSKKEVFEAWDYIASSETGNVAVVCALDLEVDESLCKQEKEEETTAKSYSHYPKDSIAVVGMACRTAAGDTLDEFWEAIKTGKSMVRGIDMKRFPNAANKEKMFGNFLSDIDSFDHQFFKKSKREAAALDPHQRVLLQTTFHALESAGYFGAGQKQEAESHDITKDAHKTGCFIGMNAPDYPMNLACHPTSPYTGFGLLRSFVAGRLSHNFGWTGPSQIIDTACSSAMVAVHQACRAIQGGECTRAVAGGVNLIINMVLHDAMRVGGFLNETGACKTFDVRADGYCRGEAVGVVVLKSLERALKDGDDIQGVLLATGNNQSINNTSITNPVLESQAALYRDVLARAGVSLMDVFYVEAHGTGIRVGDFVELEGIR